MSKWIDRDFRPRLHYTAPFGWINDPNGLNYADGEYHLFAQYYPYDTVWGPMHWIHATSKDLLHWRQLGVALRPDQELGMIFSGSAIVDKGNTSGFGEGRDPMICMFTHHGQCEQQSIAYSTDYVHFTKFEGNPVIPNPGIKDFRDPKVFYNPVKKCWSVIIAAGDHVDFYASPDFKTWKKTGEFGKTECKSGGVFECPDIFPITAPDGTELWLLILSNTHRPEEGGHRTQYFLGQFDGDTFHQTVPMDKPEYFDQGYDNYASVSFGGAKKNIILGWGTSWAYSREEPTSEFCGQMTYAREVSLKETPVGLRMASKPIVPEDKLTPAKDGSAIGSETFHVRLTANGPFEAAFANEDGETMRFGLDAEGNYFVDRSKAGINDFNQFYALPLFAQMKAPRICNGKVEMDVYFDRCIAELFADEGVYVNTSLVYPKKPYTKLFVKGAEAQIALLED